MRRRRRRRGLPSGLLTGLLYKAEDLFGRLPIHWMWWPALGGLAVGLGGLLEPRALGVGYDVIADLLAGHVTAKAVALILLVKSIIWIVALASGTSGGVLAPLLIFGGCLGWLEGQFLPGDSGAWALLGMGAMMGGTMRSPLTAVLFAAELTGDFTLLTPLLIATGAAYAVTVLMLKRSILTEKIARKGQHIVREYSVDPFELLLVGDVMVRTVDTLPGHVRLEDAIAFFSANEPRHKSYTIENEDGRVVGMASRADILRWRREAPTDEDTLSDRLSDEALIVGYADETVAQLADRMAAEGVGRVAILERGAMRLVGLVSKEHLASRCSVASSRTDNTGRAAVLAGVFSGKVASSERPMIISTISSSETASVAKVPTSRPLRSTVTRSQKARTSAILWVIMTTVAPPALTICTISPSQSTSRPDNVTSPHRGGGRADCETTPARSRRAVAG